MILSHDELTNVPQCRKIQIHKGKCCETKPESDGQKTFPCSTSGSLMRIHPQFSRSNICLNILYDKAGNC
jgi:hypothetical protein